MIDHPVAQCAIIGWCGSIGLLKWLDAVVIPEFILWGTAIIVALTLISWAYRALQWLGSFAKRNRSDDGTHY